MRVNLPSSDAPRSGLPIRRQLQVASIVVVIPLVVLALSSVLAVMHATSRLDQVVTSSTTGAVPLAELEAEVRGASALAFAALGSPQATTQFAANAEEISAAFAQLAARESLGDIAEIVDVAQRDWEQAREAAQEQLEAHVDADAVPDLAYLGLVPFSILVDSSADELSGASAALVAELARSRADAETVRRVSMVLSLIGAVLAISSALFILRRLSRNIARPIEQLSTATSRLSEGHLSHRVEIMSDDEFGQLAGSFNSMAQAIERGQSDLAHQASHDSLTGLGNRAFLIEHLEASDFGGTPEETARRAILLVDLDEFKRVNDLAGHLAGDQVLVEVGARIRRYLRRHDAAVRLGGDEFAIVLNDLDHMAVATEIAERILTGLREPLDIDGTPVELAASIGIAEVSPEESGTEALRNADLAMYEAKRLGKDGYAIFRAELHSNLSERVKVERELKIAIERDELAAHYQPIVDLESSRITGVEALVRWHHPDRGLLPPDEFIPIAEETGLVIPLGWWMLQQACRDLGEWRATSPQTAPRYVSVNMSVQALQNFDCIDRVESIVAGSAVSPTDIVLEITETEMLHYGQTTRAVLTALRRFGIRIAIDDFGTGYSSLAYLTQYPVDILKIDKAFIDAVGTGSEEHALATAIVAIGEALHIDTIAEGVEHAYQAEIISDLGCLNAQGYHYSRPIPAGDIARLLAHATPLPAATDKPLRHGR